MREWASAALAALAREPVALVTILATEGSCPREAGTRMVVTAGTTHGTIGGGNLEYQAIDQARRLLGEPCGTWRVQDYPLGPLLGQCCGGRVRLVIEQLGDGDWLAAVDDGTAAGLEWHFGNAAIDRQPRILTTIGCPAPPLRGRGMGVGPVRERGDRRVADASTPEFLLADRLGDSPHPNPSPEGEGLPTLSARGEKPAPGFRFTEIFDDRTPVALFGAGHVGRALAPILAALPFALGWYDSRADAAPATILPEEALADLARGSEGPVLIMTHDHSLDYRLTVAALSGAAAFVGLIGSATKRARFLSRLIKDGFDEAARARLHCPIGIVGIHGKEPAVIAVAVAAQLLALRP